MTNYSVTKNNKMLSLGMIGIGIAGIAYGFASDVTRTWASLLHGNFYLLAIALAGLFFYALQFAAEVGWSAGILRIPLAMAQYLPYACGFLILIFLFGHHDIYHWTHPQLYDKASPEFDKILFGKQAFLNIPFFVIRLVLYGLIWAGSAIMLRKYALEEDKIGGTENYWKSSKLAHVFLVLFAVTSSTGAWDILMSIDAHWFSTLFGWYVFAGMFVTGMTVLGMFTIYLKRNGYLPKVNENHLHDIGKFMFAFSVFWTYLWFSQFMLIWYANLPEEVAYYALRQTPHFKPIFIMNFLINFFVPFLTLMTRDAKRKENALIVAGILMIIGHWLDVWLIIMPGIMGTHAHIGIVEICSTLFFGGLFLWVFFNAFSKAPVVAEKHPMIEESYHFQV